MCEAIASVLGTIVAQVPNAASPVRVLNVSVVPEASSRRYTAIGPVRVAPGTCSQVVIVQPKMPRRVAKSMLGVALPASANTDTPSSPIAFVTGVTPCESRSLIAAVENARDIGAMPCVPARRPASPTPEPPPVYTRAPTGRTWSCSACEMASRMALFSVSEPANVSA